MTVDHKLLRDDETARIDALDVSRSFIVQAPAGSGKTELLIQRYLKLLAIVDEPEEILAITFTRKAAAEMRLRVLQALRRAERGEIPREDYERVTAGAALAAVQRDRTRNWNLISQPRRMRIQTIDALNASIARTRPLTAGGAAAVNTITADAEMRRLYRDAATLTLDQLLESGAIHDATELVLLHLDNNTFFYVDYLARMLATRDQWLPFIAAGLVAPEQEQRLRRRFEGNLEGAIIDHLEQTRAALPGEAAATLCELADFAAQELHADGRDAHPACQLRDRRALPASDPEGLPLWQGLAELLLTRQGLWRKTVNKGQGFPAGTAERDAMLELLQSLHAADDLRRLLHHVRSLPPLRYSDEQWSVLLALFRLLPLAVTELKRLFSEGGVTDHTEVALSAAEAVGTAEDPGDIALLLDYQLRHVLVDEMQDTSSAQYRMLEALTGGWQPGDGRTLFCVGDPMQSIYRFRNAEVGQFLLAREGGLGSVQLEALTLRRNFRSGAYLVDWFNDVFPAVLTGRDDPRRSAVAYTPAVAVPELAGQGRCVVHPHFGDSSVAEADAACRVIRETLQQDPDDELAVLVRSRSHLPQLLSQLRRAGIAYRAIEIDRLTDLPEIIDILALTRALVHPGDRLAWLALLRSPWAGLDWTDLHALVCNDAKATVRELLYDERRLARLSDVGHHIALRVRDAIAAELQTGRVDSLRDRVERLWLALGGPALLVGREAVENVYRFLDVIEGLEAAGTLRDVAELEDLLDDERVSSDNSARLQVMTMHRAKGLQFDHVLLFGLGRAPRSQDRDVLSWFDIPGEHGSDEKVISPIGPRAEIENDPLHRFIELTESVKNRNETGRLLYVACTRARRTLHLFGHVPLSADGQEFRAPPARTLLGMLWPAVADDFAAAFTGAGPPQHDAGPNGWVTPMLRRFVTPWSLPDPPPRPGEPGTAQSADRDRAVEYHWVGGDARVAGTIVHRWLQLAADERVELGAGDRTAIRETSERWLRELGVAQGSVAPVIDRVVQALSGISADPRGRWLLDGAGHAELPLSGLYQGRVESVVVDRVRIDADGTHWLVDYKTSSHEGGDLAGFLQAEADRYHAQLEKYVAIYAAYTGADVRAALYFPLLQAFVEVPI